MSSLFPLCHLASGFLICSSHYLCSAPVRSGVVSCNKAGFGIPQSPSVLVLTHLTRFKKSSQAALMANFRRASAGAGVKRGHVKRFNWRKSSFWSTPGNCTRQSKSGSCLKYELYRGFSWKTSFNRVSEIP